VKQAIRTGCAIGLAGALAWAAADLVGDVRARLARNDFAGAASAVDAYRHSSGNTPESLEALSWIARAELSRNSHDLAQKYAEETYGLATTLLKTRRLDRDPNAPFPLALGAAIEVESYVMALRGARADAVAYLRSQLLKFAGTSVSTRIQKNINILSLQGKPAPPLQGATVPPGKTVLLFFWAHWCPDCKAEAAVLKQLKAEFGPRGLVLIAPTQHYGYVANGEEAPPAVETRYIEQIRRQYYSGVIDGPLIVNEQNFKAYGASTTPTLVLIDRKGLVRMYHPGAISYQDLRVQIAAALS